MATPPLNLANLLDVREVAALVGVTPTVIYRHLQRGSLPGRKVGHRWVIDRGALPGLRRNPAGRPRKRKVD